MRKKQKLAWLLLSVCMLMLAVAVFPHHHHRDFSLCVSCEQTSCEDCDCPGCTHESENKDCGVSCLTSFKCRVPSQLDGIQPCYSFVVVLSGITELLRIRLFDEVKTELYICRIDSLYMADYQGIYALRAPPSI